jgi:hypothetical protein
MIGPSIGRASRGSARATLRGGGVGPPRRVTGPPARLERRGGQRLHAPSMRVLVAIATVLSLIGPAIATASSAPADACAMVEACPMAAGDCPQAWSDAATPMPCCAATPATTPAREVAAAPSQAADLPRSDATVRPVSMPADRASLAFHPPASGLRLHLLLTVLLV